MENIKLLYKDPPKVQRVYIVANTTQNKTTHINKWYKKEYFIVNHNSKLGWPASGIGTNSRHNSKHDPKQDNPYQQTVQKIHTL